MSNTNGMTKFDRQSERANAGYDPVMADGAIATTARNQYGLFTLAQVAKLGVTERQLHHRARTGHIGQYRRGVWAVLGAQPCWEQQAMAAVLAGGPETVLSHAAAARLWGFERWQLGALIEITEHRRRSSALLRVQSHHSVVFGVDRTRRHGIPVTSAERTAIDLSGRMGTTALGKFVDDGLRRNIIDIDLLAACAARLRPAPGRRLGRVDAVVKARRQGWNPGDSNFETRVAAALRTISGAGELILQYPFAVGGRNYRIDIAHPAERVAHECDGWEFHRSRSAFSNDRARANDLVTQGWTVLRYTTDMSDAAIVRYASTTLQRLRANHHAS